MSAGRHRAQGRRPRREGLRSVVVPLVVSSVGSLASLILWLSGLGPFDGSPLRDLSADWVRPVLTFGSALLTVLCYILVVRRRPEVFRLGRPHRTLRTAARLLPAEVRDEYLEEWLAWQRDLRERGAPWWRRAVEVLSVLVRLPWLVAAGRAARRITL